jgi:DNA-binding transcriptional regulator YhcF (GntR family)
MLLRGGKVTWAEEREMAAQWTIRDVGEGRVWFCANVTVTLETAERIKALLAQDDAPARLSVKDLARELRAHPHTIRRSVKNGVLVPTGHTGRQVWFSRAFADELKRSLSLKELAAEIDVHDRTIQRAVRDGILVPTWRKGRRLRFSREYADRLKERVHEARLRGFTQVLGVAAGTGPIVGAVRMEREQMSSAQWARATLWKRKHVRGRSPNEPPAKPRRIRPMRLTAEEIEARERLAADRAKLAEGRKKRKSRTLSQPRADAHS